MRRLLLCVVLLVFIIILQQVFSCNKKFPHDFYSQNVDLNEKLVKPGLDVDTLPIIKIDYGNYKPAENVGGVNSNESGVNDEAISQIRNKCLTTGYYLGKVNQAVNCRDICSLTNNESVEYVWITDGNRMLNGNMNSENGAWCLPTVVSSCNLSTSVVIYAISGWLCLPSTDAFAGDGGNLITVCNGTLYDAVFDVTYEKFIPNNLVFSDVYEDTLPNGKYRFYCKTEPDELKNNYIVSPVNRLHQLRNWCISDIPFASGGIPNFQSHNCVCPYPFALEPVTGKCTACPPRFNNNDFTCQLRSSPCYSIRDYVEIVKVLHDMRNDDNRRDSIIPCGLDQTGTINSESTQPRCIRTHIPIYQPPLPSNSSLQYLSQYL